MLELASCRRAAGLSMLRHGQGFGAALLDALQARWRIAVDARALREAPEERLADIGITRAEIDARLRGKPYF